MTDEFDRLQKQYHQHKDCCPYCTPDRDCPVAQKIAERGVNIMLYESMEIKFLQDSRN